MTTKTYMHLLVNALVKTAKQCYSDEACMYAFIASNKLREEPIDYESFFIFLEQAIGLELQYWNDYGITTKQMRKPGQRLAKIAKFTIAIKKKEWAKFLDAQTATESEAKG